MTNPHLNGLSACVHRMHDGGPGDVVHTTRQMKSRPRRPVDARAAEREARSRKAIRQTFVGGILLAGGGLSCLWILNASLGKAAIPAQSLPQFDIATTVPAPSADPKQFAALLDTTSSLGPSTSFSRPYAFEERWAGIAFEDRWAAVAPAPAPEQAKVNVATTSPVTPPDDVVQEIAEAVPMPMPRPSVDIAKNGPSRQDTAQENKDVALAEPAKEPSLFERLFGKLRPANTTLAYASPDGGILSNGASRTGGRYDSYTAVYDISARTVYMPDGTKLEAHSGLGSRLDDPRYVNERMRGATPPATYELKLRESLFHGVEAIRLTPVDSSVYGRTGLLAHTYMLGPNGDSNGCVSFKNYNAFLQAYKKQHVKRLVVVARLDT